MHVISNADCQFRLKSLEKTLRRIKYLIPVLEKKYVFQQTEESGEHVIVPRGL